MDGIQYFKTMVNAEDLEIILNIKFFTRSSKSVRKVNVLYNKMRGTPWKCFIHNMKELSRRYNS